MHTAQPLGFIGGLDESQRMPLYTLAWETYWESPEARLQQLVMR